MEFANGRPGAEQGIIRSLTFEALSLKHICCIEINDIYESAEHPVGTSENEIEEMIEEEKGRY